MHLRQRRHLDGIVGDERRLYERALGCLSEYLVDELALAHNLCILDSERLGNLADFLFGLAFEVIAGLLLDGLKDRQTAVGGLEADDVVANLHICRSVDRDADLLEQLLGEGHHPVVVLVADIELHAGELGIVAAVHSLVAEVAANLIDALKSADDEPLQIELGGDAQIKVCVERVVVGDERAGAGSTGNLLENGRLDLRKSGLVEDTAHRAQYRGALLKGLLDAVVDHEVDVALTVAQLRVVELVVCHAVLILHDGQRLEALREHRQLLCMDGDFARLCAESISAHADEVADVHQFLEHLII